MGDIGETRRPAPAPRPVELVQDQGSNEIERRLAPVIRSIDPLPSRVAQGQRDVLSICDFVRRAEAHLLEEIETCAAREGARLPAHDHIAGMLGPPSRRHFPQFALLVVDETARRPGQ